MTAKISPNISMGSIIPVDALAPYAKANKTTATALNPFKPALASPTNNAAKDAKINGDNINALMATKYRRNLQTIAIISLHYYRLKSAQRINCTRLIFCNFLYIF